MDLVCVSVVHDSAVSARIIYRIIYLSLAYACALFLPRHVAHVVVPLVLALYYTLSTCYVMIQSTVSLSCISAALAFNAKADSIWKMHININKLNRECLYASEANEHLWYVFYELQTTYLITCIISELLAVMANGLSVPDQYTYIGSKSPETTTPAKPLNFS